METTDMNAIQNLLSGLKPVSSTRLKQILSGYSTVAVMDKSPKDEDWPSLPVSDQRTAKIIDRIDEGGYKSYPNGMGVILKENLLAIDFDAEGLWPEYFGTPDSILPDTLQVVGKEGRCQVIFRIAPNRDTNWVLLNRIKMFKTQNGKVEFRHGNKQSVVYGCHPQAGSYKAYDRSGNGITELEVNTFKAFLVQLGVPTDLIEGTIQGTSLDNKKMVLVDPEGTLSRYDKFDAGCYQGLIKVVEAIETQTPEFELTVDLMQHLSNTNRDIILNGVEEGGRNEQFYRAAHDYHALWIMFVAAGINPKKDLYQIFEEFGERCNPKLNAEEDYKDYLEVLKMCDRIVGIESDDPRALRTSRSCQQIVHDYVNELVIPYNQHLKAVGKYKDSNFMLKYVGDEDAVEAVLITVEEQLLNILERGMQAHLFNLDSNNKPLVQIFDERRDRGSVDLVEFVPEHLQETAKALWNPKYYGWVPALTMGINVALFNVSPAFEARGTHRTDPVFSKNAPWSAIVGTSGIGKSMFTKDIFTVYNYAIGHIKNHQQQATMAFKSAIYEDGNVGSLKMIDFDKNSPEYLLSRLFVDKYGHSNLSSLFKNPTDIFNVTGYASYEQFVSHVATDRIRESIKKLIMTNDDPFVYGTKFFQQVYQHGASLMLDELSQIFNFNEYKGNGASSSLQTALTLKSRGLYERDLKSGNNKATDILLGILGGIQPKIFYRVNNDITTNSGFVHRFMYSQLDQRPDFKRSEDFMTVEEVLNHQKTKLTPFELIQCDLALSTLILYHLGHKGDTRLRLNKGKRFIPSRFILDSSNSLHLGQFIDKLRIKHSNTALKKDDPMAAYYAKLPPEMLTHASLHAIQTYVMDLVVKVKQVINITDAAWMDLLIGKEDGVLDRVESALEQLDIEPLSCVIPELSYRYACTLAEASAAQYNKLLVQNDSDLDNYAYVRKQKLEEQRLENDVQYRNNKFANEVVTRFKQIFTRHQKAMSAAGFVNRLTKKTCAAWCDWARTEEEDVKITLTQLKKRVDEVLEGYMNANRAACFTMTINSKHHKTYRIEEAIQDPNVPVGNWDDLESMSEELRPMAESMVETIREKIHVSETNGDTNGSSQSHSNVALLEAPKKAVPKPVINSPKTIDDDQLVAQLERSLTSTSKPETDINQSASTQALLGDDNGNMDIPYDLVDDMPQATADDVAILMGDLQSDLESMFSVPPTPSNGNGDSDDESDASNGNIVAESDTTESGNESSHDAEVTSHTEVTDAQSGDNPATTPEFQFDDIEPGSMWDLSEFGINL